MRVRRMRTTPNDALLKVTRYVYIGPPFPLVLDIHEQRIWGLTHEPRWYKNDSILLM